MMHQCHMPSLFASDLEYFATGLARDDRMEFTVDPERRLVSLTPPKILERTLKRVLPRGALPDDDRLHLSTDRRRVQDEIVNARAGERLWPRVHLLWDLHPAMEWLNYHLLVNFGRAQAPVVTLRGALALQELVFLMQGEIPKRQGQAIVHSWFGVRFDRGACAGIEELPAFLERSGFARQPFPNPASVPDLTPAATLLPEAIAAARRWMSKRQAEINAELAPKFAEMRGKLAVLRDAKHRQLARDFHEENLSAIRLRQKQMKARQIDGLFADYTAYMQDTLTTEDAAFIRVAAMFRGE
jgi:hypothetical protein